MFGPMAEAARRLLDGYSDEQLALLVEFHRLGRELQQQQAAMIRERIADS